MKLKSIILTTIFLIYFLPISAQWIGKDITISGQKVSNLRAMYFINKDTGWVVGDAITESQILKTIDGGNTWALQKSNSFNKLDNVFFINQDIGFATGDNGSFLRTIDGGNKWTTNSNPPGGKPSYLSKFYFINDQIGFYTSTYSVFKTIDSGDSWYPVLQNSDKPISNISFNDDGIIGIVVCFSGKVYKTSNSGESWQTIPQFTGSYLYDVSNTFDDIHVAGSSAFFKSSDFGDTWTIVSFPQSIPGHGYISVTFPSTNVGFCGGEPYEIYKTIDGGNNWVHQMSLHDVYSPKIQMINDTIGYILADPSSGKFYKTINGGSDNTTAIYDISSNFKTSIYPNPASTNITIDYGNFNVMSGYTLTIVNSIGQTVFTTPINQKSSYIDLSSSTGKGIYFIQLIDKQNNLVENKKIVIQ